MLQCNCQSKNIRKQIGSNVKVLSLSNFPGIKFSQINFAEFVFLRFCTTHVMNLSLTDSFIEQQRCRQWTPLITQQLRLRHLYRVTAYNIASDEEGSYYYTLHLTTMSAPFYTSEKIESPNPKWAELDVTTLSNSAAIACVLRIWQACENELDTIVLTWGINFSGLIHLGSKLSEVQPSTFKNNSVILHLRGGYFTSVTTLRTDLQSHLPFIDNLNVVSTQDNTVVYRNAAVKFPVNEIKQSYKVEKLRRLQSLQISVRNANLDVQVLRGKITEQCGLCGTDEGESSSSSSLASPVMERQCQQLLTMTSLNKMLQDKPNKYQKQKNIKISKQIEVAKFRTKMLSHERNKMCAYMRHLKQKYATLVDDNEEKESELMEKYRNLCKDIERLREWKKEQIHDRETLLNCTQKLQQRRKQLFSQILFLYPIECTPDNLFKINGIHLPNADLLQECSVSDLSVALGYVTHVLIMCSSFLNIPLRFPVTHIGSRSIIIDHISPSLGDTKPEYPLYLRGKERLQFNYAVCLLNKNIAQLRWLCGLNTQNLKATLPNLLSLVQGKNSKSDMPMQTRCILGREAALSQSNDSLNNSSAAQNGYENEAQCESDNESKRKMHLKNSISGSTAMFNKCCFGSSPNISDPVLDILRHEYQQGRLCNSAPRTKPAIKNVKFYEQGSSLSQILAIPEAFLNHQISPSSFRNYMTTYSCPTDCTVESASKSTNIREQNIKISEAIKIDKLYPVCDIIDGNCNAKTSVLCSDKVEQGTELLDTSIDERANNKTELRPPYSIEINAKLIQKKRISRSVGSYTDEDNSEFTCNLELGSDPQLSNRLSNLDSPSAENNQQNFRNQWSENKSECTGNNVRSEDALSSTIHQEAESLCSPLTLRTDALLNTTSFNLVRPKF